ncbi:hypothetical protein MMC21_000832 [Puttea exsequens]|nr:hypothetical protein [Puttea exsequens]
MASNEGLGEQFEEEQEWSDWEIEEGLPQFRDQFIQQYLQGREQLIEQESSQRSDASFRQSLNPIASEACTILSRILAEERTTIWSHQDQDTLAGADGVNLYPGMQFQLAQETMRKTKSWRIIKKMPKGALLHAHFDAMADVDWLIDQVLTTPGMTMSANQPLSDVESREHSQALFQYNNETSTATVKGSIWSSNYEKSALVSVTEAAKSFPNGGVEGFKTWLKGRCTISTEDSMAHHEGVDAIWRKFMDCFPILDSIEMYEPIFRAMVQHILHQVTADGIRWVDFRYTFASEFRLEHAKEPSQDASDMLRVFDEEVKKFKASEESKGFWGCRFIWTTIRRLDKKQVVKHMKECIAMKKKYPHIIAGYDFVGQEDGGRPLVDITPELFWFKKRCMENGVDIPFFFHAGECLGDGDETDQNLFDAILLGTRRIGHAFSLYKHPLLLEMVKTKKILIESCPISNEVLRLTSSIKAHPLPALLSRGVPCALSNDDPAILGHRDNGVTHDFWQALQGWENLGLAGLGSLAENSVRWAAYEDQSTKEWNKEIKDGLYGEGLRGARMRDWMAEWNEFCEWIVLEYAIDYGGDDD